MPIYEDQPLFGDVNKFLNENGFMFNKFLGLSGRALKPLILNKDLNKAIVLGKKVKKLVKVTAK